MLRIPLQVFTSRRAALPSTLRRTALLGGLAAIAALAFATNALAASGTVIHVAQPNKFGDPSVAVDSSGTAYIAWANEVDLTNEGEMVEYCVLPAGASTCKYSNIGKPFRIESGSSPVIEKVQVLVDGSTVVLLAYVYGVGGPEYEPVQEWQSTDGGASFNRVLGGKSVSNFGGDPVNAVIVPGSNVLGIGTGEPGFDEFPLSPTVQCSAKSCSQSPFATLQSPTKKTEHSLAYLGGSFASDLTTGQEGVLGIYPTFSLQDQCNGESSDVFDYVYGSGSQGAGNNYDTSVNGAGSAWKKELSFGGCEVSDPVVAGGPSGFGVAENDTTRSYTVYQKFNQSTEEFEPAYSTIATTDMEGQPSLSQDGLGGIYLVDEANNDEGIVLAYSSNGGSNWTGPTQIESGPLGGTEALTSAVGSTGQGWAVWRHEESVYAQQFDASDAAVAPAPTSITTAQTSGTTSGASITIPAGTVGESDKATIAGANAGAATGTVTYVLYSSSSCTSAPVFTGTSSVSGGAAGPVTVSGALAQGTYYWKATYSGDSRNDPSTSACGSEVLTVSPPVSPPPSSEFKVKAIVTSSNGTITITIVVTQSGEATLEVTISTTTLASSAAVDAKSKKCKHGKIKLKGKCVSATTVVGKTSGKATAGVPLKLTVHLSNKIKRLLQKGKTVHLAGKLAFQSALGGKPTTHTYSLVVKGLKHKHKK